MNKANVRSRFHIYTGFREGCHIKNQLHAGEAYEIQNEKRSFHVIKMWAFPREVYYLSPNRDNSGNYTLFAKKIGDEFNPTFRRPVGFGIVSEDLKQHLEIQFTFPRQRVFMSLFPDQVTIDSLFGAEGGVA